MTMKMRKPAVNFEDSSSDENEVDDSEEEMDVDSDEALQEAFASGKLKPGLVVVNKSGKAAEGEAKAKPAVINDIPMLKLQLEKIKLPKKFGWVERLDIVNDVAALAPEIALQLDEHKGKRTREIQGLKNRLKTKKGAVQPTTSKSVDEDPVHNDFVREMTFYRQAQEAVLKSIPRLTEMKIPTKRPDDYFAEMAKTDSHMQKVAQVLLKKQTATERAEKVRKLREQKKFGKQTQVQVLQERQKAKKEMLESVKKYRKGQKGNLDFLEERKPAGKGGARSGPGSSGRGDDKKINRRRQNKNEKYGYGGKKKGSKWNTRDSLDTFDDGGSKGGRGGGGGGKSFGRGKPGGRGKPSAGANKRPGKLSRQKMKGKRN